MLLGHKALDLLMKLGVVHCPSASGIDHRRCRRRLANIDYLECEVLITRKAVDVAASCTHLDQIEVSALPEAIPGCEDCLKIGARWLHLRMCTSCGHIGCCDSSPNRHATAHAQGTGHPVIRSAEPGEDWFWCYQDEVAFALPAEGGAGG
jgi:hypothetical protein